MKDATSCEPRVYLTANALKFIAIIAMAIDHIAYSFVPSSPPSTMGTLMHIIGLTAAPTMFYFAVEGYHHTRNIKKYLSRLAFFAVISWFPFLYFLNGGILSDYNIQTFLFLNVIYTILLGVLSIYIRRNLKNPIARAFLILFLIILSAPANWGYWGVIIILVFDYFYGNFKKQAFGYCMMVLLNVILSMNIHIFLVSFFTEGIFDLSILDVQFGIQELGMLIPIILLSFYNGQRGKGGTFAQWFFYIFYPLHLLVLGFLQTAF